MIREQVDPVEWLQEKLKVEFISGSEVMEIALAGSDPEELAAIVNAVKNAYMDEVVNVDAQADGRSGTSSSRGSGRRTPTCSRRSGTT